MLLMVATWLPSVSVMTMASPETWATVSSLLNESASKSCLDF